MPGRVALALSGGVARSIAHVGVLQELEASGISIGAIAGTSGGSVVGAFYAATRDLGRMADIARSIRWRSVARPVLSRRSLLSGERLAQFCRAVLGDIRFDDLSLPFVAVATDLRTGEPVILREGPVVPALVASCSLPVLFPPVSLGGRLLMDGGASSQLPVLAARESLSADVVLGVDVNANAAGSAPLGTMIQIGVQFIGLFAMANARRERRHADVMIDVDATNIALHDLKKAELLLARGRAAVKGKLTELKAAVARAGG